MGKILSRLFVLLIGLGFILISLEIFLRINPKFEYIYSSFKLLNKKEAPMLKDFTKLCLRPSLLFGYENTPNCDRVNSYGLVGKEYKLQKDSNIFRILLLGDSIAWQNSTREFLEEALNNNSLNPKYKFEIWNSGVPSYDVRRYFLYLKYKGLNYKPDMIIIFLFMNDFSLDTYFYYKTSSGETAYYYPISEISKKYVVSPFFMKHSFLYRFIILRLNTYLLNKKKIQGINMQEETGNYYLKIIKEMCEKNKIPLFVVVFPYLKPLQEYEDFQMSQYQEICRVIKDLKINHLNLYKNLPEEDLYSLRNDERDEMHPNEEGQHIIAQIIYDYLLGNYFKR